MILDYLSTEHEMDVINRFTGGENVSAVEACTTGEDIVRFQWLVRQVPVSEATNRYAVELVRATRPGDPLAPDVVKKYVNYGASVRATMFLVMAAKAFALMDGRYHVSYDDLQKLVLPIMRHRVLTNFYAESDKVSVDDVLTQLIKARPAPRE